MGRKMESEGFPPAPRLVRHHWFQESSGRWFIKCFYAARYTRNWHRLGEEGVCGGVRPSGFSIVLVLIRVMGELEPIVECDFGWGAECGLDWLVVKHIGHSYSHNSIKVRNRIWEVWDDQRKTTKTKARGKWKWGIIQNKTQMRWYGETAEGRRQLRSMHTEISRR